ncbi:MAG: hypothetical protein C4560_05280 [Nitrospiraceae bacterium]|nr:MAG: hypothetical protein C4560_05280 [Nitrospiraceae bacterium]
MKKSSVILAIIGFVFILSACGGGAGGDADAPADGSITTSVSSIPWEYATDSSGSRTGSFTIVVKNANGIPLEDVSVTIFNTLAEPFASSIQLYDGNPDDGAPAKDAPMTVTTDENGSYTLYFDFVVGVEYASNFQITSGSLSKSVSLEVTEAEDDS